MAKPVSSGQRNKQRGKPVTRARHKELPVSHWAHAVALLTEQKQTPERNSRTQEPGGSSGEKPEPEDFSEASDFSAIHIRALSSQI